MSAHFWRGALFVVGVLGSLCDGDECDRKLSISVLDLLRRTMFLSALVFHIFFVSFLFGSSPVRSGQLASIGVASNFLATARQIATILEGESTHKYLIVSGSSGKLATQIFSGAPIDVFMAADIQTPMRLIDAGFSSSKKPVIYARGQLVLYSRGLSGLKSYREVLSQGVRSLCIANPITAPYGVAAEAWLRGTGMLAINQQNLVKMDQANQVFAAVYIGAAEAGLVPLSAIFSANQTLQQPIPESDWIPLRSSDYPPIYQSLILTKNGEMNQAAVYWLKRLQEEDVSQLITQAGYISPSFSKLNQK